MKNFIGLAFLLSCWPFLEARGNSISQVVTGAIMDNKSAQSLIDWEQSPRHPRRLFREWRAQLELSSAQSDQIQLKICHSLMQLDGLSLTVFENEIQDSQNRNLISSCKIPLARRLEAHHQSQKKNVWSLEFNNFRFPDNIQKRETTNGYYAVTGDVAKKEVILTFDDGPSIYTESIVKSLNEVNAKAIFFMLGKNVRANPKWVRQIADSGHAIGSHSETHPCLGDSSACSRTNGRRLSFAEAAAEIRSGHQAIQDVLGWVDPFFRFPYGESSEDLRRFLGEKSVANFYWSIDSEDWRAQTNDNLLKNVLTQLDQRGRGILLFHDIQRKTAEIMPALLRALYHRGYSIVLLQSSDENARYNSKLVKRNIP